MLKQYEWHGSTWQFEEDAAPIDAVPIEQKAEKPAENKAAAQPMDKAEKPAPAKRRTRAPKAAQE